MRTEPNTGNLVLGGILLGVWAFMALGFGWSSGDIQWMYGGLLAFLLTGALYASRSASPEAKTPIYIGLGLLVGFIIMAMLMTGNWWTSTSGVVSFLVALLGAISIVNGLPRQIPEPAEA